MAVIKLLKCAFAFSFFFDSFVNFHSFRVLILLVDGKIRNLSRRVFFWLQIILKLKWLLYIGFFRQTPAIAPFIQREGPQAESPLVKQTLAIASFIQRAHWGRGTFSYLGREYFNFMNILSHDINALTPVSYSIPFPFAPRWRQFFCNCQYSKNTYITAFCSRTSIGPVPSGISYF